MPTNYEFIPGSGISIPFANVGEAAGELAGTAFGGPLNAINQGIHHSGPVSDALDWLEANGGPFASGFVRGLRRTQGAEPTTPGLFPASGCSRGYRIDTPVKDGFNPGPYPNSVWERFQESTGGISAWWAGDYLKIQSVDCAGNTGITNWSTTGQGQWFPAYGPPRIVALPSVNECSPGSCPAGSSSPVGPSVPVAPVVPVPPAFPPTFLPIPIEPGGPIVVVPVVPIIPVFVDADLNINADIQVDIRPQIQIGPFNIQIGPASIEIYPSLPGKDAPRLPPGTPRPSPDDDIPPTLPPAPSPPAKGQPCEREWTQSQISTIVERVRKIKQCACQETGDSWTVVRAAAGGCTVPLPPGKKIVATINVTTYPRNIQTQWGGGGAPDVFYCGWYSHSTNGAGDRKPVHYLNQELILPDSNMNTELSVTLYDGYEGVVTVVGYAIPD
jgi:hypothetical protein